MINTATIVLLRPMKKGDPTEHTYRWGESVAKLINDLNYNLIDIQKDDVNYENVSSAIKKYRPRVLISFSHGCPTSLLGQSECVITRKFDIDQLLSMDPAKLDKIISPVKSSCPGICDIENDLCNPLCLRETNINLLKGTIVVAIACHSSSQLGRCGILYGVQTYVGFRELLMFPVDTLNSQDTFGQVHITLIKELLLGHTITEAEAEAKKLEDQFIRKNKGTKYLALPMLWNQIHREVLGDPNAMIYK